MADAVDDATKHYIDELHLNLGAREDISLTLTCRRHPRKLPDVSRMGELGWEASNGLCEGTDATHEWGLAHATFAGS